MVQIELDFDMYHTDDVTFLILSDITGAALSELQRHYTIAKGYRDHLICLEESEV